MIKSLEREDIQLGERLSLSSGTEGWSATFVNDFRSRFSNLLGYEFKRLNSNLALSIIKPELRSHASAEEVKVDFSQLDSEFLKK